MAQRADGSSTYADDDAAKVREGVLWTACYLDGKW